LRERVPHTGELHHYAVIPLTGDGRLGNSELVYTVPDDFQSLVQSFVGVEARGRLDRVSEIHAALKVETKLDRAAAEIVNIAVALDLGLSAIGLHLVEQ